jgi:hypothetical protein
MPARPTGPPPPPALMDAFAAVSGTPWEATDAFREALCAYVPPSLLERSVTWCIEAYYRAA